MQQMNTWSSTNETSGAKRRDGWFAKDCVRRDIVLSHPEYRTSDVTLPEQLSFLTYNRNVLSNRLQDFRTRQ